MSLIINLTNVFNRVGTEFKAVRSLIGDLASLSTSAKGSVVAAINEVAASSGEGAGIDDSGTGLSTTWSSSKTQAQIDASRNQILGGAGAAYDTLQELRDLLGDSEDEVAALTTLTGQAVRFESQSLSGPQQTQARANIGAASAAAVGDTETNFVAVFETALTA